MNSILTFLQLNRQRLNLAAYGVPAQLSFVMITPRFRASSHIVLLALPTDGPDPVLVAKTPRLAGPSASLNREVANLQAIQGRRAAGFETIPRVIAFEKHGDRPLLVETALAGQPLDPSIVRRDPDRCCRAVLNWLLELQTSVAVSSGTDRSWFKRLVEQPLNFLLDTFPLTGTERELLEQTWERLALLAASELPLVINHGDLSHPNLLWLKDGRPGVVDWELADLYGLPACDLFFFLTYVAFARHKARSSRSYLAAFQQAFFGQNAWTWPYVNTYAQQFSLSPEQLTPLLILCWLRYLTGLLSRLNRTPEAQAKFTPETANWLRANRYYALWQYTVTHANELHWR
jgi:aminoglycoside phosphotransferase (APT) family kinase protein